MTEIIVNLTKGVWLPRSRLGQLFELLTEEWAGDRLVAIGETPMYQYPTPSTGVYANIGEVDTNIFLRADLYDPPAMYLRQLCLLSDAEVDQLVEYVREMSSIDDADGSPVPADPDDSLYLLAGRLLAGDPGVSPERVRSWCFRELRAE